MIRMSDFLFAMPGFLAGMGSAIDIGGTMMMFNESPSPEEADALALANDWAVVNGDVRKAVEKELLAIA